METTCPEPICSKALWDMVWFGTAGMGRGVLLHGALATWSWIASFDLPRGRPGYKGESRIRATMMEKNIIWLHVVL